MGPENNCVVEEKSSSKGPFPGSMLIFPGVHVSLALLAKDFIRSFWPKEFI